MGRTPGSRAERNTQKPTRLCSRVGWVGGGGCSVSGTNAKSAKSVQNAETRLNFWVQKAMKMPLFFHYELVHRSGEEGNKGGGGGGGGGRLGE